MATIRPAAPIPSRQSRSTASSSRDLARRKSARWDNSLKYRVTYGPVHFGAMYKFADGNSGCNYIGTLTTATSPKNTVQTCYSSQNDAYQFNLGGSYGALDIDAVGGVYHQAVVIAGGNSPLERVAADRERLHQQHRRRRQFDGEQRQHLAGAHVRQRRLCDRCEIYLEPVQVFCRLCPRRVAEPVEQCWHWRAERPGRIYSEHREQRLLCASESLADLLGWRALCV